MFWKENLKELHYFEDLRVDWMVIFLKLTEVIGWEVVDWIDLVQESDIRLFWKK